MLKPLSYTALAVTLCAIGLTSGKASAAITVTDFQITSNSISFNISGTLPEAAPRFEANTLFLLNTRYSGGHAMSQEHSDDLNTVTFTGTQSFQWFVAGRRDFGDYITGVFTDALVAGEALNGILTIVWDDAILQPEFITDISDLKLYWGTNTGYLDSGTFLATVSAVPEPTTVALLSAGAAALVAVAARRRRNKA